MIAASVFVGAFVLRFLSLPISAGGEAFDNDQFYHLSRARQTLLGELPFRDFNDPGIFLRIYASTAFQILFGHNLLGELLLCTVLASAASMLAFLLAARVSRSSGAGLVAASVLVITFMTPHNYPKIFVPLCALWFLWRYIDHRSRANLVVAALCTAIAFLFRHDYGIYVGLAAVAMLVSVHWHDGRRRLLRRASFYACAVGVFLLPFFTFVQLNGGILTYFGSTGDYIRRHIPESARAAWSPLEAISSGSTAVVEDTDSADRRTGRSLGQVREATARVWLALLFWALPPMALIVLFLKRLGSRAGARSSSFERSSIVSLAVLAAAANPVLLREATTSRLADAAAPAAVLLAWLLHQLIVDRPRRALPSLARMRGTISSGRWGQLVRVLQSGLPTLARTGLAVALLLLTSVSLWLEAPFWSNLERSAILSGPSAMVTRASEVARALATSPPIDLVAPPGQTGQGALIRYVYACLKPTDRLLVAAQRAVNYRFYFYSGRGFAGGHPTLHPRLSSSLEDQQLTVARLQTQSVPIALVDLTQARPFESEFALVHRYLLANHVAVQESSFGDARSDATVFRVLVDRRIAPTGVYEPLSLPCFS